jgi:hypothetical protein
MTGRSAGFAPFEDLAGSMRVRRIRACLEAEAIERIEEKMDGLQARISNTSIGRSHGESDYQQGDQVH